MDKISEVYRKLARHLDNLPGGFPSTESGVELRILRRLFTPEDAELALHDARRQQRELVDLVADHQRVAGVVAALEARHYVGAGRQPIDQLALALVAPLGADHRHVGHLDASSHPAGGTPTALRQGLGGGRPRRSVGAGGV